jgi:hypothetical protein
MMASSLIGLVVVGAVVVGGILLVAFALFMARKSNAR